MLTSLFGDDIISFSLNNTYIYMLTWGIKPNAFSLENGQQYCNNLPLETTV